MDTISDLTFSNDERDSLLEAHSFRIELIISPKGNELSTVSSLVLIVLQRWLLLALVSSLVLLIVLPGWLLLALSADSVTGLITIGVKCW